MQGSRSAHDEAVMAMPDAILAVDATGTIVEANAEAGLLFVSTPDSLHGRALASLIAAAPEELSSRVIETTAFTIDGTAFAVEVQTLAIGETHRVAIVRPVSKESAERTHWLLNEMGVLTTYAWLLRQRINEAAAEAPDRWARALSDLDELERTVFRVSATVDRSRPHDEEQGG